MAQYHITLNDELLHGLFTRDEGLAKLLEQVLNQILEPQVEEQLGARRYERTEERKGYRNGSYPRQLTTRVGRLTLRVPRTRDGEFSTGSSPNYCVKFHSQFSELMSLENKIAFCRFPFTQFPVLNPVEMLRRRMRGRQGKRGKRRRQKGAGVFQGIGFR